MKKFVTITILILVVFTGLFVYVKYYYVFATGVKSGVLNYAVYKGNVFKTYEGKLIQQGFGRQNNGSFQSYEFTFSVDDPVIFQQLERNSGKVFDLHYKEFHGRLPWRGHSVYMVDSILAMRDQ
ncbi:hypothetical protein SAMN05192529_10853 [Arachidicoccus rhizosphaerae]|uniref:6-phosphogluconate dehydrogenase n=1 Tax=Arachidicoccus rhizosphaerae TaxID=551991 RepID=A0A1H3YFJ3_9BACT|nr:hypothetical protein [Arachidicoccus rhizosphaerae]SEA10335.1 hypothetical protein SAMN05192529_10853 [Arachidicoccus rhizosphaerae]